MPGPTSSEREVLPIPDRPYDGPVYEDAKDPGAKFPPIEPLRPPDRCAERADRPDRRRRLRLLERLRWARATRRPPSGSPATG